MQIGDDLKERKMYGKLHKGSKAAGNRLGKLEIHKKFVQMGKNRENSSKHKRTKKGDDREAARGRVRK